MATPSKNMDRRAERTRQMLRQAFLEVVREKGLTKASVQDIVERANVSRGTFYAHYADKYALIETMMREGFHQSLSTVPMDKGLTRQTLRLLIQTVLDYFKSVYQRHHRSRDIGPVIDKAIHEELSALLLQWLKHNKPSQMSPEMMAQIISWAIFGAALEWSRESNPIPADQMADQIMVLLMDGIEELLPET